MNFVFLQFVLFIQHSTFAGAATGSGCKLDSARVWTATPCPDGGVITMAGAKKAIGLFPMECTPGFASVQYRCCADSMASLYGKWLLFFSHVWCVFVVAYMCEVLWIHDCALCVF